MEMAFGAITILIIAAVSFVIAVIITKYEIPFLRKKAGQNIREEGLNPTIPRRVRPVWAGSASSAGPVLQPLRER